MKNIKKIVLLFIVLLFCLVLNTNSCSAASTTVNDENDLITAVNNATNGDVIELATNIVLTRPLEITGKTITINGNGHTVSRIDTNWTTNGSNGSLITAGLNGTKLTLRNINLRDAHKYGVQSYDGAYVVLDNVTIANCGFGGVLVNAGTVEIKSLSLNKNGTPNNNGIEIAKGNGIYSNNNKPILIMNGTLSSTETENVIYLAVNDQLSSFETRNTDGTINKVLVSGNKVVITDANNNILFESNENSNVPITGESYVETPAPSEPEPQPAPAPESKPKDKNKTPKTGLENNLGLAISIIAISTMAIIALKRKNH